MDQATALRKLQELKGVTRAKDATLRIEAIQAEKVPLNNQIAELTRFKSGLGGFAVGKVREFDQQIAQITSKIASLDRDIEALSTQSEPIDWRLLYLDEESDRALVISTQIVALMPFDTNSDNSWQRSTIRSWLNGDFFTSLPPHVRARVLEAPIDGAKDRVFLLSLEEAKVYFDSDDQRVAPYLGKSAVWWLRSPGYGQRDAARVFDDGYVYDKGYYVLNLGGVRPALWLNLGA
ncbi:MAG: DUF6273 domain-containing protein [Propionibacteriaceae bacterium]|jgi:hypothetical protein|nr:DUF6273 domain-containing protein [Propionibacteriaceae bacterium]